MMVENDLWIDVGQTHLDSSRTNRFSRGESKLCWRAIFAAQICIRTYEERLKLKWGFSPAFLLEEALERQKLFIESQYSINPLQEQIGIRSLSLRCLSVPSHGILLGLIGKVEANSRESAISEARLYWRELKSVFPYDYVLHPASAIEEFRNLTATEILENCKEKTCVAQIRRFEIPIRTRQQFLPLIGLWQTGIRSDEQIWRLLACSRQPVLFNILFKAVTLLEEERQALWRMSKIAQTPEDISGESIATQYYESWANSFLPRRFSPWGKHCIIQLHLASVGGVDEYLLRGIGSALTRDTSDYVSPGFQVATPSQNTDGQEWCKRIIELDAIPMINDLLLPWLSDIVDLHEAHAVFRLPYPPLLGLPDVSFLEKKE